MTSLELLEILRRDMLRDYSTPYLWSDTLLYTYMAEAQEQFCRKTYALVATTEFDTVIGQSIYPMNVLWVASMREVNSPYDMGNYTRRLLPSHTSANQSKPTSFVCDEATRTVRMYPVPDAIYTIEMRAATLPTAKIDETNDPEIPEEYHLDLLEYAAYRALNNNDPEGLNTPVAKEYLMSWKQRLLDAKREYYRYRTGANATAANAWTGKRNGNGY